MENGECIASRLLYVGELRVDIVFYKKLYDFAEANYLILKFRIDTMHVFDVVT